MVLTRVAPDVVVSSWLGLVLCGRAAGLHIPLGCYLAVDTGSQLLLFGK